MCSKKRAEPDPVDPVMLGDIRYEAPFDAEVDGTYQIGGAVVAYDVATGDILWVVGLYQTAYDDTMETDKQEELITSLDAVDDGTALIAQTDADRSFRLDLKTRVVSAT